MEYLRHYLQLFNQPEFIFLSNPCKDSWVCQSAALVTDDWVNEGSPYQCLCTILVIYNSAVKTVLQAFKYIALPPLEWNLTRVFLRHSDSFWWVSRLKLNHTWPEHGGLSRIFSHPTHIPPTAWLGALVWVSCVPKHSSPVKWLSVQFVMCPENQWPPLITQRCGRAGHCPSPVSPGPAGARRETGRAAVWAITGPGLFFFFFTTKALKPQLEPTGCHRHSLPYEHLRGVSVDLYLCWEPARFTLTTYSVLTLLCLLLSMLLRSTLLLWCTLQNGWLWLFSLKVYIC